MILQGDVWWAEMPDPVDSAAGYRRPVVVIQGDHVNRSRIGTVICVPMTGTMQWSIAVTNLPLTSTDTGLDRDSVAQTTQIVLLGKNRLVEHVGRLSEKRLQQLLAKLDIALGRA